tara:strand:- start:736 stop:999 length:264 start_codon:yes stop_codon:yes gene_type:complete
LKIFRSITGKTELEKEKPCSLCHIFRKLFLFLLLPFCVFLIADKSAGSFFSYLYPMITLENAAFLVIGTTFSISLLKLLTARFFKKQ